MKTLKGIFSGGGGQEAPATPDEQIVTDTPESTPQDLNQPVVTVPDEQSGDVNVGATDGDLSN